MQFSQVQELNSRIEECFLDKKTRLNNIVGLIYLMRNLQKQFERYEENWSFIMFNTDIKRYIRTNCDDLSQEDVNLAAADILRTICRESDIISICNDSRFCILTRVFEGDDMIQFADKILKHLSGIEHNGCKIDINAKFGITFSKHNDTVENFIERAELALKKAESTQESIVLST